MEGDRKAEPFLTTEFNELDGHFSPDRRWVAYVSDISGSNEIYVRPFTKGSEETSSESIATRVSKDGGAEAVDVP